MLSVIVPTKNSEQALAYSLSALVSAAAEGVVREVLVVDSGSTDGTERVADAAGCDWLSHQGPRGLALADGAKKAGKGEWLLFLPPEAHLEAGWHHEAQAAIERVIRSGKADSTAFSFAAKNDAFGIAARASEWMSAFRSHALAMPSKNQGLLISRRFYKQLGGHQPLTELEDLDLVRRVGRWRLVFLRAAAISPQLTSEASILGRIRKGLARFCVAILRIPPQFVLKLHG
ncbi:glycosyl transferase family protein [Roseibium sp. TrichSKD4]|uniref:glycosyltransferase n=1 Tax=Roseibium sp. TrichSKD4 TaxID=744980 RepID=UPI0001E5618A|nr:glycosyltransferase [Roseibium sp. TrichSKD4]EFO34420.1 glycosyl transferase family protein [Roseibium sp. TrichSKD4]